MAIALPNRERTLYWIRLIQSFGLWQIASQAVQLLTGFFLIRWMTIEAYAQYGLALGFQNALGLLVDLGFSTSIVALVGDRIDDPAIVTRYVLSARVLRRSLLLIIAPVAVGIFLVLAQAHHWPISTSLILLLPIIVFLLAQGDVSCYASPLLMHHEIRRFYKPALILNGLKLFLSWLTHCFMGLGAVIICSLNAAAHTATAYWYRASATRYLDVETHANATARAEILRYVAPLAPAMLFYAVQGQIQIFLISAFGKTHSIAEVAALARLGQIFMFFAIFSRSILAPHIAKIGTERLAARYVQGMTFALGVSIIVSGVAFVFPDAFLWLLGAKYASLRLEVGLSLTVSSLFFVHGVMLDMNSARGWIYHWTNFVGIPSLLAGQALYVWMFPLGSTRDVIYFSLVTAVLQLVPQVVAGGCGLCRRTSSSKGMAFV
jgi:O-antigen/teichoic acid export membrane protein